MYTVAKSMFTNTTTVINARSSRNPVSNAVLVPPIIPVLPYNVYLDPESLQSLQEVETFYSSNLRNKTYTSIPTKYQQYIDLYALIDSTRDAITDPNTLLVYTIVEDALVGAINAFTLYTQNASLRLDNTNLQNTISTIMSNKNDATVSVPTGNTGQLSITKTFTLAPVFNYYIVMFGMPAYGVGFDPNKIYFIEQILINMGVNPYG
jgi:hypothetical protein